MTVGKGGRGRDPWDGIVFDDAFVRGARKREPAGADRAARAASLRTHLDSKPPRKRLSRRRRVRSRRWRATPTRTLVVLAVLGVGYVAQYKGWIGPAEPTWIAGDPVDAAVFSGARPRPAPATSTEPLGTPAPAPPGGGPYSFLATQEGSTEPVAYDPCRPIPVVVNPRTAPPGADELLAEALDTMSSITGLSFALEGPTDERIVEGRSPFQPERYGNRWAPVLIAWSDPNELAALDGSVAGVGGSTPAHTSGDGPLVYVTGIVALDGPAFAEIVAREDGYPVARAIVLHELAHLVGLDHVEGDDQLMAEKGGGITEPQAGDITGLSRLGRGACVPNL